MKTYLDLLNKILLEGEEKKSRTGVNCIEIFGVNLQFDLRNNQLPLLTTRKMAWKSIVCELLWFIRGETSSKSLERDGVNIWKANANQHFIESGGINGDLGPIYGFQWRHWGANYCGSNADYSGQGIDQLAQVVEALKVNPTSRRIILSAWNVGDLTQMALPPCHVMAQFNVSNNGELSCLVTQRSADVVLGLPFNIASYALLTHMLAHVTGLAGGKLFFSIGSAHIYKNHLSALYQQLEREPKMVPKIYFNEEEALKKLENFKFDNFRLEDYNAEPPIKFEMSV